MAGHSQFKNIMYRKGAQDKKRAKQFAKLIREITVAARSGLPDPETNPRLRAAIAAARAANMPKDNIERAIRRGAGLEKDDGTEIEEITYEGYGPNGVALLIECLTDNRNRAATDVRTALTRNGGSLADAGSVSYTFSRKGVGIVPKASLNEDDVLTAVLDAGAEEVNDLGEAYEVVSEPADLLAVRAALQGAGIEYESAESSFVPSVTVPLDEDGARRVFRLIEALEDCDDVQNVYANFDVSDDVMAAVG